MVAATAQRLNQGETLRNAGRDAEGRDANGTKPTKHEREERATEAGHQQSRMDKLSDSWVLNRKSTLLNSSHYCASRMPSYAGYKKQYRHHMKHNTYLRQQRHSYTLHTIRKI